MAMWPKKTKDVCREKGVSPLRVRYLLDTLQLQPPTKDSAGDYRWSEVDVERLMAVVSTRRRQKRAAEPAAVGAA
jgi:hypothetical protein